MDDFLSKDELYDIAVDLPMQAAMNHSTELGQLQTNAQKLLDHIQLMEQHLQAAQQANALLVQQNAKLAADLTESHQQSATEFFWAERWAAVSDVCQQLRQQNLVQQQLLEAANLAQMNQPNV